MMESQISSNSPALEYGLLRRDKNKQIKQFGSLNAQDLEEKIQLMNSQMLNLQRNGSYSQAEKCKETLQQMKKELSEKKNIQMIKRHKRQLKTMEKANQEDTHQFNLHWDEKIKKLEQQAQRQRNVLESKLSQQIENTKKQLNRQISDKVKQSSECLNLRNIEEKLAKQKKYSKAHEIQQQICQLEKKQKILFEKQRATKIQTAIKTLHSKHKTQMDAFEKRIKSAISQQQKQRKCEFDRIKLKYVNLMKQLKSQQEKELLSIKGQFKSKGGMKASRSMSKSKIFSSAKLI